MIPSLSALTQPIKVSPFHAETTSVERRKGALKFSAIAAVVFLTSVQPTAVNNFISCPEGKSFLVSNLNSIVFPLRRQPAPFAEFFCEIVTFPSRHLHARFFAARFLCDSSF